MDKEEKSLAIMLGLFKIIEARYPEFNHKGRDLEAVSELADVAALLTSANKEERETGKKLVKLCVSTYQKAEEARQLAKAANKFEPKE